MVTRRPIVLIVDPTQIDLSNSMLQRAEAQGVVLLRLAMAAWGKYPAVTVLQDGEFIPDLPQDIANWVYDPHNRLPDDGVE